MPALAAAVVALGAELVRRAIRGAVRKTPPRPEKRSHAVVFGSVPGASHGEEHLLMNPPVVVDDPLFWLRDDKREDKHIIAHLKEENKYTNYMTLGLRAASRRIYKELLSHLQETDSSVPARKRRFVYYSRTVEGKSYKFVCRKPMLEGGAYGSEEVMLDVNKLAAGTKHCDLGDTAVSPDDTILAYSVDTTGYETYEIHFLDLATGAEFSEDTIAGTNGFIMWGKDNSEVYYGTQDEAHRSYKVLRHVMKTGAAEATAQDDVCLYTETNEEFSLYPSKSRSGRFIFLNSDASTISEVRFLDLDNRDKGVQLVAERATGILYDVVHARDDQFYIVTNRDGATNFKLMSAKVDGSEPWKEFLPYNPAVKVDGVCTFADFAVISGREGGYSQLWMLPNHDPERLYVMPTEEAAHVISVNENLEYDTKTFRYSYSSLTTPSQVFDYDTESKTRTLLKEQPVPNYDRTLYKTERLEAISKDGTRVPISLVYNKNAVKTTGPATCHLYGYGSYEISIDPSFSMARLPLLDRGVIYAIAHIRGGGEFGRDWYEQARFENKKRTFEDFVACAEKLVSDKRTTPEMLSMEGRSAGGLLMGAVMNMRPELFKAVIAGVPFVDVLNTMQDPSIPLTTGEWQEWGNPHMEKYHKSIKEFCPYTNVGAKPYPATLILTGLYDPRVLYSEPAKWAAKLREHTTKDEPILLKVDMSSGHFSASNRYTHLREKSFEYAWLLQQLGAPKDAVAATAE